jgi:hypothetical protein
LAIRKQRVELKSNSAQNYISKWEIVKHGVLQGSVLGPLLFNTYINDFPLGVNTKSDAIMFADDTSVHITNKNFNEFENTFNTILKYITTWFHANQLILNIDKMNIVKFTPTNIVCNPLTIKYVGKVLTEVTNFKFLGLHIDNHLNWRRHIEWILPKLSAACYTIRKLSHVLNIDVLKTVYFANFHSVVEYGMIFWGNSSNIGHVFLLQKKVIRIMVGASSRCSCRSLFRKLDILTLPCLYNYSLMLFVLKSMDNYQTNIRLIQGVKINYTGLSQICQVFKRESFILG